MQCSAVTTTISSSLKKKFVPAIAFVNQKGGCSKSTSSTHLCYWLNKAGHKVLLVDADVQKSSSRWLASLEAVFPYQVLSAPNELLDQLPELTKQYDYVVIDGPAGLTEATRAILLRADLAIVPCQPTGLDLDSAGETIYLIRQAQSVRVGLPKAAMFIARAVKGTKLKDEAVRLLGKSGLPTLKAVVHQSQTIADAFGQGVTVFSSKGRAATAAAREYDKLFREIVGMVP